MRRRDWRRQRGLHVAVSGLERRPREAVIIGDAGGDQFPGCITVVICIGPGRDWTTAVIAQRQIMMSWDDWKEDTEPVRLN
jgi:hypothetical protein